MDKLKEYLRRRLLRRCSWKGTTGLRPLKGMKTATVLLDVSQEGSAEFRTRVKNWFLSRGIRASLFYFDFRKPSKDAKPLSPTGDTLTLRQLSCYTKRPLLDKFNKSFFSECNIFVSFVENDSFALKYMSAAVPASFKIGAVGGEAYPYDLVVSAHSPDEMLNCMEDILSKIS